MSCDEDDRQVRALEPDAALQIQAVHRWHSDVCNQTARPCQEIPLQELFCKRKSPRREPGGFNEACQGFTNPGVIIHNSYDGFAMRSIRKTPSLHSDSSGNKIGCLLCPYINPESKKSPFCPPS